MLIIIKSSPCDELMQAGDTINITLIKIYVNSLHLFSIKYGLKYFIELSENTSLSEIPNSINKFLDHSKMSRYFKFKVKSG